MQCFNTLLYASRLFLIAGGLSLIYGVMRIVNLTHGTLYAMRAYVAAWLVDMALPRGCRPGYHLRCSWWARLRLGAVGQ